MTATIDREAVQQEALGRAVSGQTMANYAAIIHGFMAKGIPADEILPRENVFTYHAWRALGRQVRRGEHGVKVLTFVTCKGKEAPETGEQRKQQGGYRRPWTATVFHVSQTDPIKV